jgi:hypothetical protein
MCLLFSWENLCTKGSLFSDPAAVPYQCGAALSACLNSPSSESPTNNSAFPIKTTTRGVLQHLSRPICSNTDRSILQFEATVSSLVKFAHHDLTTRQVSPCHLPCRDRKSSLPIVCGPRKPVLLAGHPKSVAAVHFHAPSVFGMGALIPVCLFVDRTQPPLHDRRTISTRL